MIGCTLTTDGIVPRIDFKPCLRGPEDEIAWTEDAAGKRWIRCQCGIASPVRMSEIQGICDLHCGCGFKYRGVLAKWQS